MADLESFGIAPQGKLRFGISRKPMVAISRLNNTSAEASYVMRPEKKVPNCCGKQDRKTIASNLTEFRFKGRAVKKEFDWGLLRSHRGFNESD